MKYIPHIVIIGFIAHIAFLVAYILATVHETYAPCDQLIYIGVNIPERCNDTQK